MNQIESLLKEQLKDFEEEVIHLCEDCKRAVEGKDFLNFNRIIGSIGNVVQRVAPIVATAARVSQKFS